MIDCQLRAILNLYAVQLAVNNQPPEAIISASHQTLQESIASK